MIRTITCVLYPTKEQKILLWQITGIDRYAYNFCLNYKKEQYDIGYNTDIADCMRELRNHKYKEENSWIQLAPEAVTKQAIKDLHVAYKNFFNGTAKFPKFKKRSSTQPTFYQRTDKLKIDKNYITLTKIGKLNYKCTYKNQKSIVKSSGFINPRVSFDGKHWLLHFGVEFKNTQHTLTEEVLGVDVGIKTLAHLSNNEAYKGLRHDTAFLKLEKKLKRLQRKLNHKFECNLKQSKDKYLESNEIKKLKRLIRLQNKKIKDLRKTYLYTIVSKIVKTKPSKIVIEDLNIKGMMKNKYLSKRIAEQSFNLFFIQLQHKCEFYGIELIKAPRFYASSKLCSDCGNKKQDLKLSDRVYTCECGNNIDRDYNASLNLRNYGILL